jgi:hypothetical protein
MDSPSPSPLDLALEQASKEIGLAPYYRDCVRPILRAPKEQWPTCCNGSCEPCNATLVNVATRVREILGE